MKKHVLTLSWLFCSSVFFAGNFNGLKNDLYFTENKGQIGDQFNKPRPDILFTAGDGVLTFHMKANGISYQQYRVDKWTEEKDPRSEKMTRYADQTTIYRLDISWPGANTNPHFKFGEITEGYSNYYSDVCPNGVHNVKSYADITYQNIYNGIDLKWYQKDGHLKYDYIVAAGADPSQIKLKFTGAEKMWLNKNGELMIKTPLGEIVEEAPYVLQNGKAIKAYWKLNKNVVSFDIPSYNKSLPLLIDPGVRIWGTYYGGGSDDVGTAGSADNFGNIYFAGYSMTQGSGTSIATVGSHQTTHGGGLENAFVVKFKNTGVRLWGTYYGGNARDIGFGCATDNAGNVFLCGHSITSTPGVIASSNGHQTAHGGNWDAFLVKFNSSGVRQWGTYYGNNLIEFGYSCTTDIYGNSYLTGKTSVANGTIIATPGSHQGQYGGSEDAFLVKFNANGDRVWGTYFGGEGADVGYGLDSDNQGNIYLVGHTNSTVNISTPGTHQTAHSNGGGGWDGFVTKFTNSGVQVFGSYYGGTSDDLGYGCAVTADGSGIFMSGKTNSGNTGNAIAIDGSHQTTNGGGNFDAFLVKFNSVGARQWGTYYGGSGDDVGYSCAVNVLGYPYLSGFTGSSTGTVIATPGSHQPVYGGSPFDAFLVLFSPNGVRQWGSYYGGANTEIGNFCTTDNNYNVYISGLTDSFTTPDIASTNAHQGNYGLGFSDGFFAKFYDCTPPLSPANASQPGSQSICTGNSTTVNATGTGIISWYATATSPSPILTGTTFVTPVLTTGTYTYYAGAATCTPNPIRSAIVVTVHPIPSVFTAASKTLSCPGETVTLYASGVPSYTWSSGGNGSSTIVSPTVNTTYTVTGASAFGCTGTATITISMSVCPTIGVEENYKNVSGIKVYPNPVGKNLTVSNLPPSSSVSVYNVLGEIILSRKSSSVNMDFDLSEFPPGTYFIKVISPDNQFTKKIIKH
ncbi:MAG: hypothetical protein K0S32_838 [Bacteroidetes bacterium]|jgi:hypothetical protein|nr:hypothetical protein [Bacteroidota bacterium]